MSMFSSLSSAPSNAAMKYYSQIPQVLQQYLGPYVNAGTNSLNTLTQQYGDLTNNPGQKFSQLTSGFEESPSYEYQYNQAENAANNAAAAAGGTGGSAHMEDSAKMASNLSDQAFQQYYNNIMGLYGTGLKGEAGLTDLGAKTSGEMAQGLSSNLASEGNMAAASAENEDAMIGDVIKAGGDVLGYALGGPIGGIAANTFTSGMTGGGGSPGSLSSAIGSYPTSASGGMNPEEGYAMALKTLMSMFGA